MISSNNCSWLQNVLKTEFLLFAIFMQTNSIRLCVICNHAADICANSCKCKSLFNPSNIFACTRLVLTCHLTKHIQLKLLYFITHLLIFARFYWLPLVTWCKITGQLSRNNSRFRRNLSSQLESFNFSSLLFHMEEKTNFYKVQW